MSWGAGKMPESMGDVVVIAETRAAIRVDDGDFAFWVPKSVIHTLSAVWEADQEGELVVEAWWFENGDRVLSPSRRDDEWDEL